jgi:putative transposase
MRRSAHSDDEIAFMLQEVEQGVAVEDVCRTANVSLRTFYRWKRRLGALPPTSVRRLRELEDENRQLRRLLSRLMQVPDENVLDKSPDAVAARSPFIRIGESPNPRPARGSAAYRICRNRR